MGSTVKQKLKSLRRLLCHLRTGRVVVLVEGKRDVHALRGLQFCEGDILQVSNRRPDDVARLLSGTTKTVVILTDNDKSGEKLAKRYEEELSANNIAVDTQTRKTIRWIFGVRTMEELPNAYADFVATAVMDQLQVGWQPAEAPYTDYAAGMLRR